MKKLNKKITKNQLILAIKLLNTYNSKSFNKNMLNVFLNDSHNLFTIANKAMGDLEHVRTWHFNHHTLAEYYEYFEYIAGLNDIKLNKSNFNGYKLTINIDDFIAIRDFIIKDHAQYYFSGHQTINFDIHCSIGEMSEYLLMIDTLKNGSEFVALDKIINYLLENKDYMFFKSGYNKDLLVHDRVSLYYEDYNYPYLRTNKDYTSTLLITDKSYKESDPGYQLFTL